MQYYKESKCVISKYLYKSYNLIHTTINLINIIIITIENNKLRQFMFNLPFYLLTYIVLIIILFIHLISYCYNCHSNAWFPIYTLIDRRFKQISRVLKIIGTQILFFKLCVIQNLVLDYQNMWLLIWFILEYITTFFSYLSRLK